MLNLWSRYWNWKHTRREKRLAAATRRGFLYAMGAYHLDGVSKDELEAQADHSSAFSEGEDAVAFDTGIMDALLKLAEHRGEVVKSFHKGYAKAEEDLQHKHADEIEEVCNRLQTELEVEEMNADVPRRKLRIRR